MLLKETFSRPERLKLYWKRTLEEMDLLGVNSLGIVALLSLFMGAVVTILGMCIVSILLCIGLSYKGNDSPEKRV